MKDIWDVQDLDSRPYLCSGHQCVNKRIHLALAALAAEKSQPDFDCLRAWLKSDSEYARPSLFPSFFRDMWTRHDTTLIIRCNHGTVSEYTPSWCRLSSNTFRWAKVLYKGSPRCDWLKRNWANQKYWVNKPIGQSMSSISHLRAAGHTTRLLNGTLHWLGYQSAEQRQWATSKRAGNARPRWSTCPCLCIILYAI